MADQPQRHHFRGKPRLGKTIRVRFWPTDQPEQEPYEASTDNIGAGGAFIMCDTPLPIGTDLHLDLELPTADGPVETVAEVRWLVPQGDDQSPAGMGVEFVEISVDGVLELNKYFASLTGTDV